MKKKLFYLGLLLLAQSLVAQELPFDSSIRTGKLSNGLSYFIKQNTKPEKRAELRLVINVGSIEEDEDQLGLAHLLEHMAFNGTKKYPKQELVSYLQKTGMRFGPDLNAYTSFDETVYMLQVPTDQSDLLKNGIEILSEWAHNVTLEDEEINKERGVVIEEWRGRKGAQDRVLNKHLPNQFYGSRYAERLPIGTQQSLETFSPEAVKRFYSTWYRPDLQAVVVVGDVDVDAVEGMIKEFFGAIPASTQPKARTMYSVPDHGKNIVSIASDAELPYSTIIFMEYNNRRKVQTLADYRTNLLQTLHDTMLRARLSEYTQKANPPFVVGVASNGSLVRERGRYQLAAVTPTGDAMNAFKVLLTEAEKARRFGFLESEFERAKAEMLTQFNTAAVEKDKTDSKVFTDRLVQHFLSGSPVLDPEFSLSALKNVLENLSLSEINDISKTLLTGNSRVALFSLPQREGVAVPSEADVWGFVEGLGQMNIEAYTEEVSTEPLFPNAPTGGRTIQTQNLGNGVTRLTLSNGVKVIFKPTTLKNDEILISAVSNGGAAMLSDAELHTASAGAEIANRSGVGAFDAIALDKKLAGKKVSISPFIGATTEGFNGSSSPEDLETAFQLINLYVTQPRFDADALEGYKSSEIGFIQGFKSAPEAVFQDSVQTILNRNHFRARPTTVENIQSIDLAKAERFYKDRFGNVSDFTFYFVGNINAEQVKQLAEQYLGGLPATRRVEREKDLGIRTLSTALNREFKGGKENKSITQIFFKGTMPQWSLSNEIKFNLLTELLQIRLIEKLREDMGGVYTPQSFGFITNKPWVKEYLIGVMYSSDPSRVQELSEAVMQIVSDLKTKNPTADEMQKIKSSLIRAHETDVQRNRFWLEALKQHQETGLPLRQIIASPAIVVNAVTPAQIKQLARTYFKTQTMAKFILMPE